MSNKIKIGIILLIVGIFFLTESLLIGSWDGFLAMLSIGWFLTILGASLISLRASAWAFFLMGGFLMFILFRDKSSAGEECFFCPIAALIASLHILLGLILAIISFLENRKRKNR